MKVSIIIPVYNEEGSVRRLVDKINRVIIKEKIDSELIFIDDGSSDNSFNVLKSIKKESKISLSIIRLAKNYGKSAALSAGFKKAKGDIIITMDSDLQDDPEEIPRFIAEIKKGFDVVTGWKYKRKDPLSKTIPSKLFNWITSKIAGIKIHDFNCGFKAYKAEVLRKVKIHGDLHRYILAFAFWKGYKIKEIKVKHHPRSFGKTKFGTGRLLIGFFDLISISFIHYFKKRPLFLFGTTGIGLILTGIVFSTYIIYQYILNNFEILTRPLMIIVAILFILGFQLIVLGLLGELVSENSKLDEESYVIREEVD